MNNSAHHALRRFGFGRRGAEPVPSDAKRWLALQLEGADHGWQRPAHLSATLSYQPPQPGVDPIRVNAAARFDELFAGEMVLLLNHAVSTDLLFRERLVWFRRHHFSCQPARR